MKLFTNNNYNEKILVREGAGMIGANLVKELLSQNYEVLVIDNYYRGQKENLEFAGFNFDNFLLYDLSKETSNKLLDFCHNVEISGTGSYVPEKILTNEYLKTIIETNSK